MPNRRESPKANVIRVMLNYSSYEGKPVKILVGVFREHANLAEDRKEV
jgi:hypothetical protein